MSNHPNRTPSRNVRFTRLELSAAAEAINEKLAGEVDTGIPKRCYESARTKLYQALEDINAHR
jgi:hypothetical protein